MLILTALFASLNKLVISAGWQFSSWNAANCRACFIGNENERTPKQEPLFRLFVPNRMIFGRRFGLSGGGNGRRGCLDPDVEPARPAPVAEADQRLTTDPGNGILRLFVIAHQCLALGKCVPNRRTQAPFSWAGPVRHPAGVMTAARLSSRMGKEAPAWSVWRRRNDLLDASSQLTQIKKIDTYDPRQLSERSDKTLPSLSVLTGVWC